MQDQLSIPNAAPRRRARINSKPTSVVEECTDEKFSVADHMAKHFKPGRFLPKAPTRDSAREQGAGPAAPPAPAGLDARLKSEIITVEDLEWALTFCAHLIEVHGQWIMPIFEKLERELEAAKEKRSAADRAKALLESYRERAGDFSAIPQAAA